MSSRAARLLKWYRRHRRRLPWRESPDPYRVWVSELMLQQTQVKTVVPYFERFVARFPDAEALATASEQDVLAAWSGLGYYRRARALRRAAKVIVEERDGRFPDDVEGWMSLPGIGRYTAGAIVSIAFDKPAPILDGNVTRVLSRWFLVEGDPRSGETHRRLWQLAEWILPKRSVSEFNQALMELGALVCTPRHPKCLVCPVSSDCEARRQGRENDLPGLSSRMRSVLVTMAAAVVEDRERYLLFRRDASVMRDLWEFPGGECQTGETPRAALAREARDRYGVGVRPKIELARIRHSIMNRRIVLHAFSATLDDDLTLATGDYRWATRSELDQIPVSSMVTKVLKAISKGEPRMNADGRG